MHPYKKYQNSSLWKVIATALDELQKNQDIEIKTEPSYIVGYLTKIIIENINEEKKLDNSNIV